MPAPDVTDPAPDDAPGLLGPHHVLQADVLPAAEAVGKRLIGEVVQYNHGEGPY